MTQAPILVVPRAALPQAWLPELGAVALNEIDLVRWLNQAPLAWRPRAEVEPDPSYKQLIPYLLVDHRGRLATYRRAGTEDRLHGLWSVGIGGHIDRTDATSVPWDTIQQAALRELAEELPDLPQPAVLRFLGLINEDETPVGRVHLGLVFGVDAQTPEPPTAGEELRDLRWLDPAAAAALSLERWSRLACQLWQAVGR